MPATGVAGFAFGAFAVSWAWLNYSWFASAYDTDDWLFRLATMVQMVGVVILSLGLPQMFASIDHGDTLDNDVVVAGYVVMRAALVFLWWQVSRHDPERAPAARSYMTTWASPRSAGSRWPSRTSRSARPCIGVAALVAFELAGPFIAERKGGTPWHPHHIAERYGLLVIITLGEVIIGTVAALNALVHGEAGWTHRRRAARRSPASGSRSGAGGCTSRCPGPSRWSPTASARSSSATGTSDLRRARGHGRGAARRRPQPGGRGRRSARRRRSSASRSRSRSTRAVFYALYSLLMRTRDPFHLGLIAGTTAVLVAGGRCSRRRA